MLPLVESPGAVTIDLRLEPDPSGDTRPCEEMVALVARAIELQVLNDAAAMSRARCGVALLHRQPDRIVYRLDVERVPALAWLVLVSLLVQTHLAGDVLSAVTIEAASDGRGLPWADALAALPPPERIETGGSDRFTIDQPLEWERRPSLAMFRFTAPLSPQAFRTLEDRLDVWAHLAHLGGFLFEFQEQEDFNPDFGRAAHLSPTRCDFLWPEFEGWGLAHRGLVNIAHATHREGPALASLTLE